MSSLASTKQVKLDNLPQDVAIIVADEIFSWAVPPSEDAHQTEVIVAERKEASGRKVRDLTFSSLSRLSSQALDLWRPFLFRNVTLDSKHLATFCFVVFRRSEQSRLLLSSIRHLVLFDSASRLMPELNESDDLEARRLLRSWDLHDVLDFSMITKRDIIRTRLAIGSAVKCSQVIPETFPGEPEKEFTDIGPRNYKLATKICFDVRGLVVNFCKNLETLEVVGIDASIPFGQRKPLGATIPLTPFIHSLKEVSFKRWEANPLKSDYDQLPEITCTNVIWLLLEIPNLRKASFYASLEDQDVDFLGQHSEVSELKKSSVEFLELDIFKVKTTPLNPQVTEYIADLLKFTKSLNSFALVYRETTIHEDRITEQLLKGLQNSFGTLKTLRLGRVDFPETGKEINHLFKFSKLELFSFDSGILMTLTVPLRIIKHLARVNTDSIPVLPSTLKEIRLHLKTNSRERRLFSEDQLLAELIMHHPKSSSLKTVGVETLDEQNSDKCFKARAELKKVCKDVGINLVEMVSKIRE